MKTSICNHDETVICYQCANTFVIPNTPPPIPEKLNFDEWQMSQVLKAINSLTDVCAYLINTNNK